MDADINDKTTLIGLNEVYEELKECQASVRLLITDACRNDPQADRSGAIPGLDRDYLAQADGSHQLVSDGASLPRVQPDRSRERGGRQQRASPARFSRTAAFLEDNSEAEAPLESVTRPQDKQPPRGVVALFSCSAGQRAYDSDRLKHGVFFHFVIEGLRGKADFDGAKEVTLEGLELYAAKRVKEFVRKEYDSEQVPCHTGEAPAGIVLLKLSGTKRVSLGVSVWDVDLALSRRLGLPKPVGMRIQGVVPGLAAGKAGLRKDDVILKVNDSNIADRQQLKAAFATFKSGDEVTLGILRRGSVYG